MNYSILKNIYAILIMYFFTFFLIQDYGKQNVIPTLAFKPSSDEDRVEKLEYRQTMIIHLKYNEGKINKQLNSYKTRLINDNWNKKYIVY